MRRGCAGFFSPQALAAGKGLPSAVPEPPPLPPADPPFDLGPFPGTGLAVSLDEGALEALRSGDPSPLGPIFAQAPLEAPILLPGGQLGLIHRAPEIDLRGGAYGAGFIRAEADVDPGAWYLRSHFRGDEVMPGTLMYDGCLQALRLLLLARGWLGPRGSAAFQPPRGLAQTLRCRGQVTPGTARVAYEVHVRRVGLWPDPEFLPDADPGLPREPYALAEAIMLADGRPIVSVGNLALRLSGLGPDSLAALWLGPRGGPAVPEPGPAPRTARRAAKAAPRPGGAPAAEAPPPEPSPGGPAPEAAPRAATRRGRPPKGREAPPPPPVAVKVRGRREAGQDATPQAGTSRQGQEHFDKARLALMSTGLLSEALGPLFARFDQGAFVARLPRAPFDFIDEALVRKGRLGQVAVGTQVEAAMDLSAASRGWLLAQAGGKRPVIPYAAINEMALQPCGFLAAFMGAALPFEGPMHFRNLGGEATLLAHVDDLRGRIQARATLTKSSVLGAMTILHYHFSLSWEGQPIYEGQTHFGFHSPESLARPLGLKANPGLLKALTAPAAQGPSRPFPQGPSWPEGPWRMVDSLVADTKGDGRVWGRTRVDPKAWFFAAHFPQDPVWPGSLGLEGFLQSAKALWAALFRPDDDPADLSLSWQAPFAGQQHRWLYRGQVIPFNNDVTFGLKVVAQRGSVLTLKGLMWVDGQVVYQVDDLTVGLAV
ncbi:MAG: hypothetical protein LBP92_06300 [Deltaproteobacteria bacterium]|nr:hypothetical protein [Deltaproteobacteria bacterium]